jgi:hypothetical protein
VRNRSDSLCELVTVEELLVPDNSGACRAAIRAFRPRRVVLAVLMASLLTAAGASVAAQVISTMLGHPVLRPAVSAPAGRLIHTLRWSDPVVLATGGGVALAGLLLVLSALLPGRARTMALAGDDPRFVTGVRRSSLRVMLRATTQDVPGIAGATIRLRGRLRSRAVVHAVTGFGDPGDLGDQVAGAVHARLDGLDPLRPPRVTVRLSRRKD